MCDAQVFVKSNFMFELLLSIFRERIMIFFVHIFIEYLIVKDPYGKTKKRYDHYKVVILPHVKYERMCLHLHDFKTIGEYNSIMLIISQLKLDGINIIDADVSEKTFFAFNALNLVLQ